MNLVNVHTVRLKENKLKMTLHLHNALREVGWDFSEAFTTTVHNVVVTGAAGRADLHLRGTCPRLCLCWAWREQRNRQHNILDTSSQP